MSLPGDRLEPMTQQERYFFDLYGYVVRYGALGHDEVEALRCGVDAMQLPPPGNSVADQRFTGFLERDAIFRDLIDHPAIFGPILGLCGPTARLDHAYGIHMAPGTSGLGLHGGGTPHDPAQFYEVRQGRVFNGLVAVQWALVDQGREQGGFRCIPGSHRANFALPQPLPSDWEVVVPMGAGDVVLFTEGLTHGTTPWHGPGDRRVLLYKYSPGHSAWSSQHQTTLASLRERADLSERQRRMLEGPYVGGRLAI